MTDFVSLESVLLIYIQSKNGILYSDSPVLNKEQECFHLPDIKTLFMTVFTKEQKNSLITIISKKLKKK
jgi:hypothetical protein